MRVLTNLFVCRNRGGGVGLVLASAGFGMLTAPLMELHNQKGFFLHHVILTCCTLLCIICIPLLPETAGQPLPETIAEGEGLLRRPILPGEQHHLLARTEVREYSRVQDTPLHQVVNPGNGSVPSNSTANGVRTSWQHFLRSANWRTVGTISFDCKERASFIRF